MSCRGRQLLLTACSIVRAMASGWLTIDTLLAATSVVFARIAFAIARSSAGKLPARSAVDWPASGENAAT